MTLIRRFDFRCLVGFLGMVCVLPLTASAGPLYSIVDLGSVATETDLPRLVAGDQSGLGYITNTTGQIVSQFDKTPTALPAEDTAPYGEKVIADSNSKGTYVGTEAVYNLPQRPEPGHVAIDMIVLHYHAAIVNRNLRDWTDLHNLFAKKGWDLESANKIDNAGRIEGLGLFQGVEHAYLLIPKGTGLGHDFPIMTDPAPASQQSSGQLVVTPVPEPTSLAVFGLIALVMKTRRRLV